MVRIIFMIDDDQDDREIFHEAIRKVYPSVQVDFAKDGDEALAFLNTLDVNPDVIFLDHYMPRKTGVQCLRALKADVKTRSIPVIMYTMSANLEEEKVALLLGADYYMKKTASFEHLCMEVKRLLTMVENQTKSPGELRG